eukprot:6180243-Pleurochrysis_carterae.AAC.2
MPPISKLNSLRCVDEKARHDSRVRICTHTRLTAHERGQNNSLSVESWKSRFVTFACCMASMCMHYFCTCSGRASMVGTLPRADCIQWLLVRRWLELSHARIVFSGCAACD